MSRTEPVEDNDWWVIVPMKDTRRAKTRLGGSQSSRRQIAILMARDTLCAVTNAERVRGVLVVCDREEDVESFQLPGVAVLVSPDLELNEAIQSGMAFLRAEDPERDLAVLPGDLPYLRSSELDAALALASRRPLAVIRDRQGTGTTLLTVRAGAQLVPAYGPSSLRRHRDQGAQVLGIPAWSGLRRDVDMLSDLAPIPALGRRTRALLEKCSATSREKVLS